MVDAFGLVSRRHNVMQDELYLGCSDLKDKLVWRRIDGAHFPCKRLIRPGGMPDVATFTFVAIARSGEWYNKLSGVGDYNENYPKPMEKLKWLLHFQSPVGMFMEDWDVGLSTLEDAQRQRTDGVPNDLLMVSGQQFRRTGDQDDFEYVPSEGVIITPVSGSDLYFGFGGLSVDLKNHGTLMVAALNSWWPDGQMYRFMDGGATWSPFWAWESYLMINKYYSYSDSLAPSLGVDYVDTILGDMQIGWMMEALSIDHFNSDHFLYGTGATMVWDSVQNVSLASMADGIEETAVQALISPPECPSLISDGYDIQGFMHTDLDTATTLFSAPVWSSVVDLDYAENQLPPS